MNITLVGAGMGDAQTMTLEARDSLARADVIIGAERLLSRLPEGCTANRISLALPDLVAAAIAGHPEWREVCVVLSGDIGFYSGAKRLALLLADHAPRLVSGMPTPAYFAALLRRSWQDMRLVSAHGVECDVLAEVLNHPSVFFLTGGAVKPSDIIAALLAAGLNGAQVTVGENLATADERITSGSAAELAEVESFAPLSVVLVDNDRTFVPNIRSAGIPDGEFVRGAAPMTKREVRVMALSLLNLREADIAYDIGAGTGSVAVEMALLARRGRIHAIEENEAAFALLGANREKFGTFNMNPILGPAPDSLAALPSPRAAFIGGSKGRMRDIIGVLLEKNPAVRLVASAIALESLSQILDAMRAWKVRDIDVVQIAASRAVPRGGYHLLEAQNPVFLISGGGT